MEEYKLETPVSFHIFNRPQVTERVFNVIRTVKPRYLFVTADGPRENVPQDAEKCRAVRELVEKNIDWKCELYKNYSDANKGSYKCTSGGISWVFDHVEEAIILEDDCLPGVSFFRFCSELLERYRLNKKVSLISGNNFLPGMKNYEYSYYFSRYSLIWGWATWKRTWNLIDFDMKGWPEFRDSGGLKNIFEKDEAIYYWGSIFEGMYTKKRGPHWDYKLTLSTFMNNTLGIVPLANLVSNIGAGPDGTNCKVATRDHNLPVHDISFPLKHPSCIYRLNWADEYTENNKFSGLFIKKSSSPVKTTERGIQSSGPLQRIPSVSKNNDDVVLVGFPKSGTTWLRFLIGNYLTGNQCDHIDPHLIIPDLHHLHSNPNKIGKIKKFKPGFIKIHYPFTPKYRKVVYLVRNGFDVAVSYYFFAIQNRVLDRNTPFDIFLKLFNNGSIVRFMLWNSEVSAYYSNCMKYHLPKNISFEKYTELLKAGSLDTFSVWSNHADLWLDNAPEDFLLLYYEDMLLNPVGKLIEVLEFSGIPVRYEDVVSAVETSEFGRMQKLELKKAQEAATIHKGSSSAHDDFIPFARKGTVGDSKNYFNDELEEQFIRIHGKALDRLGYMTVIGGNKYLLRLGETCKNKNRKSDPLVLKNLNAKDNLKAPQLLDQVISSQQIDQKSEQTKAPPQSQKTYREKWPEEVISLVRNADEKTGQGRLNAARDILKQTLEILPEDPWLLVNTGNIMLKQGDIQSAHREFAKAVALAPDYALAHSSLGLALIYQGNYPQAEESIRRAIALNPADAESLTLLGKLCINK